MLVITAWSSIATAQSDPTAEQDDIGEVPPSDVADDAPPPVVEGSMEEPSAPAEQATTSEDGRLEALEERIELLEEDLRFAEERADQNSRTTVKLAGYVDVGAFWAQGNGAGTRSDIGHVFFPEYDGVVPDSWVFMGDPLSTAVNSRGEPADTGESRALVFDSVDSNGVFSFLVNTLSLSLFAAPTQDLTFNARVDFVPRRRDVSDPSGLALGDFIDVRLAYGEYTAPTTGFDLAVSVGKFDSVVGVEYRTQEAPDRIEVTPSLLCRYTCGFPIGLKTRFRFLEERQLVVNVAVTNGSHFSEYFPFSSDVDTNDLVTGAGRLSYKLPIGSGIEIGASGAIGAQDLQAKNTVLQWHFGFDVLVDWADLVASAEYVQGKAEGDTEVADVECGLAPCLEYRGAYGRIGYRFASWLLPYVRVDWRDATHRAGASYVYISELLRITGGARFELGTNVVIKGQYTKIIELGRAPQFNNDVLTTSFILTF